MSLSSEGMGEGVASSAAGASVGVGDGVESVIPFGGDGGESNES